MVLTLFLSIKGRINFLQLERFSSRCESGFRQFFDWDFNFLSFNIALVREQSSGICAIAFDPSHISKSGKKTPGIGYFWSGCAGAVKWGLEFCGVAALDLQNHTAYHLFGFQTIDLEDDESLVSFYAEGLLRQKEELLKVSGYLVADAYFSKITFVEKMYNAGFHIISRLRDDANLNYLYLGEQKKGRGRPQKHDGKVSFKNIDEKKLSMVSDLENERIYSGTVYAVAMKMNINLVVVFSKNSKDRWSHKLYFSTDLEQKWESILEIYRLRFQIEFLYRDAKQFTGLTHCEARRKSALNFHWNMSLTAINIAKLGHWIPQKAETKNGQTAFSMSDIKTQYYNELLLNRFISMFGINPELGKNKSKIKQFLDFGKIAA